MTDRHTQTEKRERQTDRQICCCFVVASLVNAMSVVAVNSDKRQTDGRTDTDIEMNR